MYLLWVESILLVLPFFLYHTTVGQDLHAVVFDLHALATRLLTAMHEHTDDADARQLAVLWTAKRRLSVRLSQPQPQQMQLPPASASDALQASEAELLERGEHSGDEDPRHRLLSDRQRKEPSNEALAPESTASMMLDPSITDTFHTLSDLYAPSWSLQWSRQQAVCPPYLSHPCLACPCLCVGPCSWYRLYFWLCVLQLVIAFGLSLVLVSWRSLQPDGLHFQPMSTADSFDCTDLPLPVLSYANGSLASARLRFGTSCTWKYPSIFWTAWYVNTLLILLLLAASVGETWHMFSFGLGCCQPLVHDDATLILYTLLFQHPQLLTPHHSLAHRYLAALSRKAASAAENAREEQRLFEEKEQRWEAIASAFRALGGAERVIVSPVPPLAHSADVAAPPPLPSAAASVPPSAPIFRQAAVSVRPALLRTRSTPQ